MLTFSVVIPALNESAHIATTLRSLVPLRSRGVELVVADGGSSDGTREIAGDLADQVVLSHPGRASQMNAGAACSSGDVIWFLHADTLPPEDAGDRLDRVLGDGAEWGWFDVRLSGRGLPFRLIERCMNLRARLSGVATGDQGMFIRRSLFRAVGGFPEISLMEDVAISKRLRVRRPWVVIDEPVRTSSRRWERDGVVRTVLLMWRLRLAYALGADPDQLRARYYSTAPMVTR